MSDHVFDLESLRAEMLPPERGVFDTLREIGAIRIWDEIGHFEYKSKRHGPVYVDHNLIHANTRVSMEFAGAIAKKFRGYKVDVVIGPEQGGRHLATLVAAAMQRDSTEPKREFFTLWAKKQEKGFEIPKAMEKFLRGRRVLVVEDVVTTGASVRAVVEEVRRCGGDPLAVEAIWNRGGKRAVDLNISNFGRMINAQLPDWPAHECPLCKMGNPLNPFLGYAADFSSPGHCGIGGRQAIGEALGVISDDGLFDVRDLVAEADMVPGKKPNQSVKSEPEHHEAEHLAPPDDPDFQNRTFDH